jgi:hypothetical protein
VLSIWEVYPLPSVSITYNHNHWVYFIMNMEYSVSVPNRLIALILITKTNTLHIQIYVQTTRCTRTQKNNFSNIYSIKKYTHTLRQNLVVYYLNRPRRSQLHSSLHRHITVFIFSRPVSLSLSLLSLHA